MLTVVVLSIVVPSLVAAAGVPGSAGQAPELGADVRGIALQTVIIMVVLLAIAGGVAAVLLSRGGEAVTDIERQDISRDAGRLHRRLNPWQQGTAGTPLPSACN